MLKTDQVGASCIETLDKFSCISSGFLVKRKRREEFAERAVRIAFSSLQEPGDFLPARPEVLALFQGMIIRTPVVAFERAHHEIFGANDVPDFSGFALNKLGTKFDRHRKPPVPPCVDPAAEPVACLEYGYVHTGLSQAPRGCQAGHTCANDEHGLH